MPPSPTPTPIFRIAGQPLSPIGQGTWNMGDTPSLRPTEIAALERGLALGLNLIDTAEMYGSGRSESLVGEAIRSRRADVFLTSKVLPSNASRKGTLAACERSLQHLGTGYLDLYLLHWPGSHPLSDTVAAFEDLKSQGKIRAWGVSNFDVSGLEDLYALEHGPLCATNQVLYNPEYRGIEFDLLPWALAHQLPITAYSPVGQGGDLLQAPALQAVAKRHNATTAQVALAWNLRQPGLCVIPKAGTVAHVEENAAAQNLTLTPEDIAAIDKAFPAPNRKTRLALL